MPPHHAATTPRPLVVAERRPRRGPAGPPRLDAPRAGRPLHARVHPVRHPHRHRGVLRHPRVHGEPLGRAAVRVPPVPAQRLRRAARDPRHGGDPGPRPARGGGHPLPGDRHRRPVRGRRPPREPRPDAAQRRPPGGVRRQPRLPLRALQGPHARARLPPRPQGPPAPHARDAPPRRGAPHHLHRHGAHPARRRLRAVLPARQAQDRHPPVAARGRRHLRRVRHHPRLRLHRAPLHPRLRHRRAERHLSAAGQVWWFDFFFRTLGLWVNRGKII